MMARRRQAGFSLVEAVVSAVVLGVGMVGLINLHTSSMRGESRAIEMSRAQEVVRQVADYYSTRGYEAAEGDNALTACPVDDPRMDCSPSASAPANAGNCTFWVDRDWVLLAPDNTLNRVVGVRPAGAIQVEVRWSPSANLADTGRLEVTACTYGPAGQAQSELRSKRMVIN